MTKQLLLLNLLDCLEELSSYEIVDENELIKFEFKNLNYYFTKLNYEIAKALVLEIQLE